MHGSNPEMQSLYRRALGKAFDDLPPVLRAFHDHPTGGIAQGSFRVTRPPGHLRAIIATLMRLPRPGEDIPVRLRVRTEGNSERWLRDFGSQCLETRQWISQDLLIEAAGPLRFAHRVRADSAGMDFQFVRCRLFGLPLPNRLSPHINAVVRACESGWWVQVRIEVPLLGLLTQYEGEIKPSC